MKILVADDNASVRRILEALLTAWGFKVTSAHDGREAWEILKKPDAPPLVILDWMMPEMDGIDICRSLRELPLPFPAYVILLTCRDQKEDIVAGLEAGADDYITKPFEAEELRARVQVGRRYVELQSALRERMTDLRRQGEELRRSNRALKLLNESNRILARSISEIELIERTCMDMVDNAGYRLAWIGFAEYAPGLRLRPVAQAGLEEGSLDAIRLAWSELDPFKSPASKALQTGRPAIVRDLFNNRQNLHRSVETTTRGFSSLIVIPFTTAPSEKGTLSIYAREPDSFDGDEVRLLVKLADSLAYGINALRTAAERRRIEEELQRERDQAQLYLDVAGVLMIALDQEGNITLTNAKGCSILGHSQEYLLGKNWFTDFTPQDVQSGLTLNYKELMTSGIGFQEYFERTVVTKGGAERTLAVHASLLHDKQGKTTGMLFSGEDVTERKQAEKALRTSEENYRSLFDRMVSSSGAIAAYRSVAEES